MDKYLVFLYIIILPLLLKWVAMLLLFPFQCAYGYYQKNKKNLILKILAAPYYLFEVKLMRGGWERYMLFQVSLIPSVRIRRLIYRCLGAEISSKVVFHFRTEIRSPHQLKVGDGTIIGDHAILDARSGLVFGKNVNLSSNVSIYTCQHDYKDPFFSCTDRVVGKVTVEDYAWLGSNVIVLPGVKIGEGAVCCSGCVVTKDVAPYTVVAGIPAKKINDRPRDLQYDFSGSSCRLY